MARPQRQESVLGLLRGLSDSRSSADSRRDKLQRLFWTELEYQRINRPLPKTALASDLASAVADNPVLLASAGQGTDLFNVIYTKLVSDRLLLGVERPIVSSLLAKYPYSLFVFSNAQQDHWHFVNVKLDHGNERNAKKRRLFRRITIGPEERLRTASERLALIGLTEISPDLFGLSPLTVQQAHDQAFDVEAVTRQFYDDYEAVFQNLWTDLSKQTEDKHWAHDYSLQFLNRCMFLYFVQRKRWLGDDPDFIGNFWNAYRTTANQKAKDSFFDRWLKVLFFEAFNRKPVAHHRHFPPDMQKALAMAPYLNGGLFKPNELDDENRRTFTIADNRFEQVFKFLERYNFTIAEDSPLDQEVAVDPEMIGKVYESLVNVSEEADQRGDAGIFYTPRTEIDLMGRLSLVDHLSNTLGQRHRNLLYELVFALEPGEKTDADQAVAKAGLWPDLDARLREVTVVDPACGSGSFLVGMLHILDDLQCRAAQQVQRDESSFDRRKRIIGASLYGADVMEWACHVAELRLWLALIVEAQFTPAELAIRRDPLLPHFSFKIRCGDSLVQEVAGIHLRRVPGQRRADHDLPLAIKQRLGRLRSAKLAFYENRPVDGLATKDQIEHEEVALFRDILKHQIETREEEAKKLMRLQAAKPTVQMTLDGREEAATQQLTLDRQQRESRIEELAQEIAGLKAARDQLRQPKDLPFVWDIAFAEVMESDKAGFDIVIGNPPYVRQENIAAPVIQGRQVTADKKAYKAMLAQAVYRQFPRFFGYNPNTRAVSHKLDAKSDLYIYFFFQGLSLLNEQGSFCFITSNSWLDVGYGADLQEFLLKHGHVKLVLDNQARRSFASADVNTAIALLGPVSDKRDAGLDRTARFVMFKVPFEHVVSPIVFEEIEDAAARKNSPEYRVFPIPQGELFNEGCRRVTHEDEESASDNQARPTRAPGILIKGDGYASTKWGGKYLRAPEVFFTILTKGKPYLRTLGEFFEGERYLNTGGADGFFILTDVREGSKDRYLVRNDRTLVPGSQPFEGEIEKRFLSPLIKDVAKSTKTIRLDHADAYCLVVTGRPTASATRYIHWGEEQGYNERSVTKNQNPWYKPTNQMLSGAPVLIPRSFSDTFTIHFNPKQLLSLRFYRLHPKVKHVERLCAFLNSTLVTLFLETLGNKNLGQGVLDFFMADFLSMAIPVIDDPALDKAFAAIQRRPIEPVAQEYGVAEGATGAMRVAPKPDRAALDDIVFNALKLTKGERAAVYAAIVEMVAVRATKASSLKIARDTGKRIDALKATQGIWQGLPAFEDEAE